MNKKIIAIFVLMCVMMSFVTAASANATIYVGDCSESTTLAIDECSDIVWILIGVGIVIIALLIYYITKSYGDK